MNRLGPGLAGTEAMRLKPQARRHNFEITNATVIHSVTLRQMLWTEWILVCPQVHMVESNHQYEDTGGLNFRRSRSWWWSPLNGINDWWLSQQSVVFLRAAWTRTSNSICWDITSLWFLYFMLLSVQSIFNILLTCHFLIYLMFATL